MHYLTSCVETCRLRENPVLFMLCTWTAFQCGDLEFLNIIMKVKRKLHNKHISLFGLFSLAADLMGQGMSVMSGGDALSLKL